MQKLRACMMKLTGHGPSPMDLDRCNVADRFLLSKPFEPSSLPGDRAFAMLKLFCLICALLAPLLLDGISASLSSGPL